MSSKAQLYREIVTKYEDTYGNLPDNGNKPLLINITGPLRKKLYENDRLYDKDVLYMNIAAIIFAVIFAPNLMTLILMASMSMSMSICFLHSEIHVDYSKVFDGEYIDIDGRMIGVVIPTQEEQSFQNIHQ